MIVIPILYQYLVPIGTKSNACSTQPNKKNRLKAKAARRAHKINRKKKS